MPGWRISRADRRTLHVKDGVLTLAGPLTAGHAAAVWPAVLRAAAAARGRPLTVDVADAMPCDTAGAALLAAALARHGQATLRAAPPGVAALVARLAALPCAVAAPAAGWSVGGAARRLGDAAAGAAAFLGESLIAAATLRRSRRQFRLADVARIADAAGAQAVPLLLPLGGLIGMILAFQAAIPLRRFGAELFVVNAVALSLLRELGPLLAGVLLAGRTGSAFAAELGTMKVNEELAALATMGISPMTMLVLPRLLAAVLVMPVMTLLMEFAGLAGAVAVLLAFGFPLPAITAQLLRAVQLHDLASGLAKAICFGAVIAGIGCHAGLATGAGPRAVGQAATRAVVGGIVACIALDAVFSILFYRLGV